MDLVILAGGKGTRIAKYTKKTPKPLVKIGKLKFLDYLLNQVCKYNFDHIYILCGYKSYLIKRKYHNREKNFVKIKCIIENKPLGTAGSLYQLKNLISKNFVVMNGDSYLEFDFNKIINSKIKNKVQILCVKNNNNYLSNKKLVNLNLVKNNFVKISEYPKFMNAGIYKFDYNIFNYIKKKKYLSLEESVIPALIKDNKIKAIKCDNFFIDIGTKKNLFLSRKVFPFYFSKPAIFLDRDGTINLDKGYTHNIKDLKFIMKTIKFLKKVKKKYYLFIVTNQAGIAKNIFSLKKFVKFQKYFKIKLHKKKILIDDVQFCLFHPDAKIKKYCKDSGYRKPGILMMKKLSKQWYIDKKNSFFIGDSAVDEKCASDFGIKFFNVNHINRITI
jgi:D,D-heptose 1,7-bisphosphate phosphatase